MLELTAPALMLAGFATSPHCALMCAPLQSMALRGGAGLPSAQTLLLLHAGRVLGYGSLGAIAGALGAQGIALLPDADYGRTVQLLAAATLLLSATLLWRRGSPRCAGHSRGTRQQSAHWPRLRVFARGLAWAAMPCGFVYSVLILASLSGGPIYGFFLLYAFGLGTVPLSGIGGDLLARLERAPRGALQRWSSALLIVVALASGFTALSHETVRFAAWCLSP